MLGINIWSPRGSRVPTLLVTCACTHTLTGLNWPLHCRFTHCGKGAHLSHLQVMQYISIEIRWHRFSWNISFPSGFSHTQPPPKRLVLVIRTDLSCVDVWYKLIPDIVYQQKKSMKFEACLRVLCIHCTYPYVNLSIAASHICSSFQGGVVFF